MEGPLNACHFVLATNQPCRAPALHARDTCRHHTPEALAHRQARANGDPSAHPDTREEIDGANDPRYLRAYWRTQHRIIAESYDDEQCKEIYDMILMALGERAISPCSAGKILLAVMDRRKFLAHLAQEAAFRRCEEVARVHREQIARGEHPDPQPALEALKNVIRTSPELFPVPLSRTASPLAASTSTVFAAPPPARVAGRLLTTLKVTRQDSSSRLASSNQNAT